MRRPFLINPLGPILVFHNWVTASTRIKHYSREIARRRSAVRFPSRKSMFCTALRFGRSVRTGIKSIFTCRKWREIVWGYLLGLMIYSRLGSGGSAACGRRPLLVAGPPGPVRPASRRFYFCRRLNGRSISTLAILFVFLFFKIDFRFIRLTDAESIFKRPKYYFIEF